jgi:hypothetical protein
VLSLAEIWWRPVLSFRSRLDDLGFRAFAFNDFIGTDLATLGVIAIIGRTVLAEFVFTYDGPQGAYTITG